MTTSAARRAFQRIRSAATWFVAEPSADHLQRIRLHELDLVLRLLPQRARILEIGAGRGWQARELAQQGHSVAAIDVAADELQPGGGWPVIEYDGHRIPFDDAAFDVVFSSNVLPHIPHLVAFQKEIHRVLKPGGLAIHVLPTSAWRFWTNVTHVVKWWTPPTALGEHAGGAISELFYLSRRWWTRFFHDTGWQLVAFHSNELFYTGDSLMDSRIGMRTRRKLAALIGASCNIVVLKHAGTIDTAGNPKN